MFKKQDGFNFWLTVFGVILVRIQCVMILILNTLHKPTLNLEILTSKQLSSQPPWVWIGGRIVLFSRVFFLHDLNVLNCTFLRMSVFTFVIYFRLSRTSLPISLRSRSDIMGLTSTPPSVPRPRLPKAEIRPRPPSDVTLSLATWCRARHPRSHPVLNGRDQAHVSRPRTTPPPPGPPRPTARASPTTWTATTTAAVEVTMEAADSALLATAWPREDRTCSFHEIFQKSAISIEKKWKKRECVH